ncbi:MAG TPA: magnesium and cobalt transport protein CorA [Mycobacteriales bacterium]|nr:magnesium and cobalt transport protein CorA [Mycobacteriales bacterium]
MGRLVIVDCALYTAGTRRPDTPPVETVLDAARAEGGFVWIGLHDPTPAEFDRVSRQFGLHPLAVRDALADHVRPKLTSYGDAVLLVLKTARYVDPEEVVDLGQVALFVGEGYVVSVRHGESSALTEVRAALEARPEILRCGPGAVLHAVAEQVVDDYEGVLDGLDIDIDQIESQVFSGHRGSDRAQRIYKLKREVLDFRRGVAPLAQPLMRLASGEIRYVDPGTHDYFRDLTNRLQRVAEHVETLDTLLTSALNAHLAEVSVQQNEDMRKISAWVAIMAVPTMVAGVYGMNFDHMPELRWQFGYPLVLAVMAVACTALYRAFKANDWL